MKTSDRLQSLRLWACVTLLATLGLPASQGAGSSSDSQDSLENEREGKPRMFRWEGRDANDGGAPVKSRKSRSKPSSKPRIFRGKKESGVHQGETAGKKKRSRKIKAEKEREEKLRIFRWEKDSNVYSDESAGRKKKSRKVKAEKDREGKPRIFRRDKEFKKHRVDSFGKRKAKEGKEKKARMFRWEKDR